uniref:Ig-like domain-containing protein n=1 Tax=Poecilia formosa TaxID=48698 RepID=A0A087XKT8_POEFO
MLGTLCALITALTCVDAAITLTQEPIKTVSAGQQVVLNCNIQRCDRNYVRWYKQVPGGVPQYVLRFRHHDSSLEFGTGFSSDRFNSKSSSDIDYQFIIKQAERGDSALYFCQTWDESAEITVVFGPGTKLIVTGSSLPPPVLTVFPPSKAELQSNKATLLCLSSLSSESKGFADVSWLVDGSPVSSGISTSTAVQRPDQTFHISSSLSIQTSDWNMNKVYACKVSLGSQAAEKTINKSGC